MNACVITLGCKVNQYESQAMLSLLSEHGFTVSEDGAAADIVVVNSCTVTASSDHKVRQTVNRIRKENPHAVLVLTGCMPQAFPEECATLEGADIVLGNSSRHALIPCIDEFLREKKRIVKIEPYRRDTAFENLTVKKFYGHTRAFLKIEDGCNRFCSYCIIPYARGSVRSKPLPDLKEEAALLAEEGYSEFVLTGINLSAYGQDFGHTLTDAVSAVCAIPGAARVRLGSLEPERLDPETIALLAKEKKLCPQFHLSLQSGCDATLRRMNRHYTAEEYCIIVRNLRAAFQNAAITTDLMVGFPGETEEEFSESLAFARKIGFAKVHVFPYSRRPGTVAAGAKDQVSNRVKEERAKRMTALTEEIRTEFLLSQAGSTCHVLFEREYAPGLYEGYSENYSPVSVASEESLCGKIRPVFLSSFDGTYCTGTLLK